MTKMLREAIDKAMRDEDIIYDDKLVLEWMDDMAGRLNAVQDIYRAAPKVLYLGKYIPETGSHQVSIDTCAWESQAVMEVHIYKGLEILAKAAGVRMLTRACGDKGSVMHYFHYKDVEFYSITAPGEALR